MAFNSFRSDYDDESYIPELERQCLSSEEQLQRQMVEDRKRGRATSMTQDVRGRRDKREKKSKPPPRDEVRPHREATVESSQQPTIDVEHTVQ